MPPNIEDIKTKLYTVNEYGYEHQRIDARLEPEDVEFLVQQYGLITRRLNPDTNTEEPIHKMCMNCQARQFIKYEGWKSARGETIEERWGSPFAVRCNFVPAGLPKGSSSLLRKYITEKNLDRGRALQVLKSTVDPVAWCELMFGFDDSDPTWRIRPYQKEQLRCTSLRFVIREGRRSGKTFAVAMKLIYLIFNALKEKGRDSEGNPLVKGPEIIVITPYQAQVANIFNEIENILKRNEDLVQEVTTAKGGNLYVKTPYYKLKLKNGASISGFVSGVGVKDDGSGGGTMRGQNADWIYLDEMDMIPEEILLKVIQPLLLTDTQGNVGMISTSTPIGKRGKFFEWCKDRPDFKEDYLPSSVLPQWDVIKYEIEADNTEEGFAAEYMAHFITGGHGVFNPEYIYAARGAYTYQDSDLHNGSWWRDAARVHDRSDLIKVIGIDWNKNAGTEFVVIAYDPNQHHWFVVEASNISAGQYSSVKWKEEVVRLNFKWKPDYIYADEGYGHTIIEDLKVEAHRIRLNGPANKVEQQTEKLLDRLKSFNFSQKVTLKSPIDHQDIVKTGKDFLVENAVRVFEEKRIWFPEDDKTLLDQLLHYVVLKRSATTNKPIYGPDTERIGDHRLDALMLALGGLFLEKSMYSGNTFTNSSPASLTKNFLETRAAAFNGSPRAADVVRAMQQQTPGVHAEVLEIRRGSTQEEHERVNEILQANTMVQQARGWFGKRQPKRRSDLGNHGYGEVNPDSVLETMLARARQNTSAGYANDTEDVYRAREIGSSPSIVSPRRRKISRRGRSFGGRRRR